MRFRLLVCAVCAVVAVSVNAAPKQERAYLEQEGKGPTKVAAAPKVDPNLGTQNGLRLVVPPAFDVLVHKSVTLPPRYAFKPNVAWPASLGLFAEENRLSVLINWDNHRVFVRPSEVNGRPAVPQERSLEPIEYTSGYVGKGEIPLLSTQVGPEEYNMLSRPHSTVARWAWSITMGENAKDSLSKMLQAYGWRAVWKKGIPRLTAETDMRFEEDSLNELLGGALPRMGLSYDLYYKDRVVEIRLTDTQ